MIFPSFLLKESIPADAPKFAWQSLPRTPEPSLVKSIERLNLNSIINLSPEESDGISTAAETVVSKKKEGIISEWQANINITLIELAYSIGGICPVA